MARVTYSLKVIGAVIASHCLRCYVIHCVRLSYAPQPETYLTQPFVPGHNHRSQLPPAVTVSSGAGRPTISPPLPLVVITSSSPCRHSRTAGVCAWSGCACWHISPSDSYLSAYEISDDQNESQYPEPVVIHNQMILACIPYSSRSLSLLGELPGS